MKQRIAFFLRKEKYGLLVWVLFLLVLAFFIYNRSINLRLLNIQTGWSFFFEPAGYTLAETTLLDPGPSPTYLYTFVMGVLNSLKVSIAGILIASALGTILAYGQLSKIPLVRLMARRYVTTVRSVPLLLWLFFLGTALLTFLPEARNAFSLKGFFFLHNRGATTPDGGVGFWLVVAAFVVVMLVSEHLISRPWVPDRLTPLLKLAPWAVVLVVAAFLPWHKPQKGEFDFSQGYTFSGEFLVLTAALGCYYAAFISESIRGAILSVSKGQHEAASALGLNPAQTKRFVITPIAKRIAMPSLVSHYASLIKDSSLAVAVGYPDLVYVTNVNITQTGRTVECVTLMMLTYLTLNLLLSFVVSLIERKRPWRVMA